MLVALGIKPDGKKEMIDFRQVLGESKTAWEGFLNHLYQRGLKGDALKLIVVDGGKGLLAAIDLVYGQVPLQRCWAHKTRNVLNHVKRADQDKVKRSLHRISHARNLREAQKAAQRFVLRWKEQLPEGGRMSSKGFTGAAQLSAGQNGTPSLGLTDHQCD